MQATATSTRDLLRAHGRCTGALIFAIFGGCWLLLSVAFFHRFRLATVLPVSLAALLLTVMAWRLHSSGPAPVLDDALRLQKQADDRTFGLINAVTYTAVFLLFVILPRLGLQNLIFPGFVALVGFHFFPLPGLYRHAANLVTGAFLVLWAAVCAIVFRADGNRMAACVALGAGAALWASSAWALLTAHRLFRRTQL